MCEEGGRPEKVGGLQPLLDPLGESPGLWVSGGPTGGGAPGHAGPNRDSKGGTDWGLGEYQGEVPSGGGESRGGRRAGPGHHGRARLAGGRGGGEAEHNGLERRQEGK